MGKNRKKARTLYQEHISSFLAYLSIMLCNGANLVMDLIGVRGQNIPFLISSILCLFMIIALFLWLAPKFSGSQLIKEDEMAKESLNKADGFTCGTLIIMGIVGVAVLNILNFSATVELNASNIGSAFFMMVGLLSAMRSGFFLLIERKYSVSDEEEEA